MTEARGAIHVVLVGNLRNPATLNWVAQLRRLASDLTVGVTLDLTSDNEPLIDYSHARDFVVQHYEDFASATEVTISLWGAVVSIMGDKVDRFCSACKKKSAGCACSSSKFPRGGQWRYRRADLLLVTPQIASTVVLQYKIAMRVMHFIQALRHLTPQGTGVQTKMANKKPGVAVTVVVHSVRLEVAVWLEQLRELAADHKIDVMLTEVEPFISYGSVRMFVEEGDYVDPEYTAKYLWSTLLKVIGNNAQRVCNGCDKKAASCACDPSAFRRQRHRQWRYPCAVVLGVTRLDLAVVGALDPTIDRIMDFLARIRS